VRFIRACAANEAFEVSFRECFVPRDFSLDPFSVHRHLVTIGRPPGLTGDVTPESFFEIERASWAAFLQDNRAGATGNMRRSIDFPL